MPLSIEKSFGIVDTSIGKLAVFKFTLGCYKPISKDLSKETDSYKLLRKLIPYICCPESLTEDFKPCSGKTILKEEDVYKLTKEDLEKIAKKILEYSQYLYKKVITKDEGRKIKIEFTDEIEIPKKGNETNVEYLHRILSEEQKKAQETARKSLVFSKDLVERISKIQKEKLTRMTDLSGREFESFLEKPFIPGGINIGDRLLIRLDEMFDVQVEIANEIKKSSDESKIYASQNLVLNKWILGLMIFSIILMIVSIFLAYRSLKHPTTDPQLIKLTKQININLERINKKLEAIRIDSSPKFLQEVPEISENTNSKSAVEKDNDVRLQNKNNIKGKKQP